MIKQQLWVCKAVDPYLSSAFNSLKKKPQQQQQKNPTQPTPTLKSFGVAFLMAAIILKIWTLAAFYVTAALNQLSVSSSNLLFLDLFYFISKTNIDLQSLWFPSFYATPLRRFKHLIYLPYVGKLQPPPLQNKQAREKNLQLKSTQLGSVDLNNNPETRQGEPRTREQTFIFPLHRSSCEVVCVKCWLVPRQHLFICCGTARKQCEIIIFSLLGKTAPFHLF